MSQVPPETARLRFRHYTLADEQPLFEVFADSDARGFYPEMDENANVRGWIAWNLRNYEKFGFGLWAVEIASTGQFIGDCGLTYQDVEGKPELEIGYHILHAERRKGYATEAAQACLRYAVDHIPCDQVCSIVRPDNTASVTVAARVHTASREVDYNSRRALVFFTTRDDWKVAGTVPVPSV